MPSPPLSIVQSLSPRIAVLTSSDVVQSCEANGCRGLEELLRPWEGGTERVSILSSTLTPTIHPTFPLRFVAYDSIYTNPSLSSPNPDVVVDLISSFVGAKKPEEEQQYALTRSLLLSSRPLAGHETFNHPVGILFAVSTSTPDPIGTLQQLHAQTLAGAAQGVPWMDGTTVLRFYVVVHDISSMGEDLAAAHELLANVKKAYGPHSTLLVINSQVEHRSAPPSPDVTNHPSIPLPRPFTPIDVNPSALSQVYASALSSLTLSPMAAASASLGEGSVSEMPSTPTKPARRKLYGSKLSAEDTQRLAALVRELVGQSLVPYMEARVREWNEVYHANRRGITGRLIGAGRKFFGSRPASPAPGTTPTGYNTVKGYYPITAVEALSRRLADFAFMLRDYRFAAGVYDSLRRDFAQDRAWRYAAAATEMYGLSLLLSHTYFLPSSPPIPTSAPFTTLQHTEISSWLEQAVVAYHQRASATQIQLDALRITVLYYEAWKAIGEWRGVGAALVKCAGEADEVPSAVMIEEAAAADVKGGKTNKGRRRRAFHLVLAARRYETAGLKTYSRRCLDRASHLYRFSPWTAVQDRIEYSLGRQAYTLGESDVAVEYFLRLLRREDNGVPGSQAGPLEDMALAYEQLQSHPEQLASSSGKLELPTPVFDCKKTRVVASSSASSSTSRQQWTNLETQALSTWDRKGKKPISLLPDEKKVIVGVGETFHVELIATNPLNAPLILGGLTIMLDPPNTADVEVFPESTLEPYETRSISIAITPTTAGPIGLSQINFLFHNFFSCVQSLERKGRRLHATKAQRLTPTYAEDTSLSLDVVADRPRVKIQAEHLPAVMYEGEEVEGMFHIRNEGNASVRDLQMIWSEYGCIRQKHTSGNTQHMNNGSSIPNLIPQNASQPLYDSSIEPGQSVKIPVILTAMRTGVHDLHCLVTFQGSDDDGRVVAVQMEHTVEVLPAIQLRTNIRPSVKEHLSYLVAVEIANVSASSLTINEIRGISAAWLTDVRSEFTGTTLLPNQVLRTVVNVKRVSQISTDLQQTAVVAALGKLVQGQPVQEVSAGLDYTVNLASELPVTLAPSYLAFRQQNRIKYLKSSFPTLPATSLHALFPLLDPLDLDMGISWSVSGRKGNIFIHGIRPSPSFSVVEDIRRQVDAALASGSKTVRTMYEETGRLKRLLLDSVLEGVLTREDDPVFVRVHTNSKDDLTEGSLIPVTFELQNRSPLLPVRWILRLPSTIATTVQHPHPYAIQAPSHAAHFVGQLEYRGTLPPGEVENLKVDIWTHERTLVNLGGWELVVETGDEDDKHGDGEKGWRARYSWSRKGGDKILEIG